MPGSGVYATAHLKLIPTDLRPSAVPPGPTLTQQPTNDYAFVYDPLDIVAMVNLALLEAFALLQAKASGALNGYPAPYWVYNVSTTQMSMYCSPYSLYNQQSDSPFVSIYFGASFLAYLQGWRYRIYNDVPSLSAAANYEDILLVVIPGGLNWLSLVPDSDPPTWVPPPAALLSPKNPTDESTALFVIPQHYAAWGCFSSVASIQVLSNLPMEDPESVDPGILAPTGLNNLTSTILADFSPNYQAVGDTGQSITYEPASVIPGARFITLTGGSVTSFNISVQWVSSTGAVYPMYTLTTGQAASAKLVFMRREALLGLGQPPADYPPRK